MAFWDLLGSMAIDGSDVCWMDVLCKDRTCTAFWTPIRRIFRRDSERFWVATACDTVSIDWKSTSLTEQELGIRVFYTSAQLDRFLQRSSVHGAIMCYLYPVEDVEATRTDPAKCSFCHISGWSRHLQCAAFWRPSISHRWRKWKMSLWAQWSWYLFGRPSCDLPFGLYTHRKFRAGVSGVKWHHQGPLSQVLLDVLRLACAGSLLVLELSPQIEMMPCEVHAEAEAMPRCMPLGYVFYRQFSGLPVEAIAGSWHKHKPILVNLVPEKHLYLNYRKAQLHLLALETLLDSFSGNSPIVRDMSSHGHIFFSEKMSIVNCVATFVIIGIGSLAPAVNSSVSQHGLVLRLRHDLCADRRLATVRVCCATLQSGGYSQGGDRNLRKAAWFTTQKN